MRGFLALAAFLASCIPSALAVVRINALGDSITGSPGCWRGLIWQRLQAAGITNTDFVGTLSPDGCGYTYDGEHDGHAGYSATGIVSANNLPGWLAVSQPDIVMMHLGTNDVWSAITPANLMVAFSTLVDQMRASKPTMRILVAQIIAMSRSDCADCGQRVIDYNTAIAAWAPTKSTAASPITVVDCWTGFNPATDSGDGIHPNEAGNVKLANCFYPALSSAIVAAGGGGTATSSTRTSSTSRTSTTSTSTSRTSSSSSRTSSSSSRATTTTAGTGGTSAVWGQCGGLNWTGPTTCVSGTTCTYSNDWYSQCLPN